MTGSAGHMTGHMPGEGVPLSPDPYAQQGGGYGTGGGVGGGGGYVGGGGYGGGVGVSNLNPFKTGESTHPLQPSFHSSQNYNSLQ